MTKRALFILLLAFGAAAQGQSAPDSPRRPEAVKEQLAIGIRVNARVRSVDARRAAQYAENRERCEAALRVAEQCGKYAGAFYCDEKGFKAIPESQRVRPVARDSRSPLEAKRCAMTAEAARP